MHVNKQYQDQITLGDHFQVFVLMDRHRDIKKCPFAGNTKQRQVSKQAANTLGKTWLRKGFFLPSQKEYEWCGLDGQSKKSLAGNKNKIGSFDGVGNIHSVQEHINSIEYGLVCDVNFYYCHKVTQDLNSPLTLAPDIPDHVLYDRHKCADFRACIQQNGDTFCLVPLTAMQSYTSKYGSLGDYPGYI